MTGLRMQFELTQLGPTGKKIRNICNEGLQYNTIQYNTIQYNTIQYNTIQYNTIQYNTIRHKRSDRFKVFKSVHHHTIQINQPTRCKNFPSLLLDVYVQLNMFRT